MNRPSKQNLNIGHLIFLRIINLRIKINFIFYKIDVFLYYTCLEFYGNLQLTFDDYKNGFTNFLLLI